MRTSNPEDHADVVGLVDHLFRRFAGRMVAILTRCLGPQYLDTAEEVVQEAMLKALQLWPLRGVPANPEAWLFSVARNTAIDRLRRHTNLAKKLETFPSEDVLSATDPTETFADDELQLIFMCCHPDLPSESQVAITLKTVGGFSVDEIARAFLSKSTTVAQRIVRAKRRLRETSATFTLTEHDIVPRLESVLDVLYLMFNEGYGAHGGDNLIRSDLTDEAIRLTTILAGHSVTGLPIVRALLALMLFQSSRTPARLDDDGALVLLRDQDRTRWDRITLVRGLMHFDASCEGAELTRYHMEAGIAAIHAVAPSYAETDWPRLLELYDDLRAAFPSPIVQLNRAVAVAMLQGYDQAIGELVELEQGGELSDYHLLFATLGDFYAQTRDYGLAAKYFRKAGGLTCTLPERKFLAKRLAECETMSQEA